MTNVLRTSEDYELFLYTIKEEFPSVLHSSVTMIRRGATLARVSGELGFELDFQLLIRERLIFKRLPVKIDWYGYEIWRRHDKLYWYDSQPHPHSPDLQSSYPHHKHLPPDIKHNRIPAPEMSFCRPNIPYLIAEIEKLIEERR